MNHNAYINPRLLPHLFDVNYRKKWDPQTIHVNPNFQGQKVFVNPLFLTKSKVDVPLPTALEKTEKVPHNSKNASKYTWKRTYGDKNNQPISAAIKNNAPQNVPVRKSSTLKRKFGNGAKKNFFLFKMGFKMNHKYKYIVNKHKLQNVKLSAKKYKLDKRPLEQRKQLETNKNSQKFEQKKPKNTTSNVSGKSTLKLVNKHIINIQGESFLLSRNGSTLKRLPPTSSSVPRRPPKQRIDFGGVTFRQTSQDVLVRTNTHRARYLLTSARQRSILCLTAKRRKVNVPCVIFRKIGRCHRMESGTCIYTHDKKNVDLCKRYLRGVCTDINCLLSHEISHKKVATCKFFLEGTCKRDQCPYLHVKLSNKAEICRQFLQGFCNQGDQCPLRHVNVCPEFEKVGACKKGKKCPYPHSHKIKQRPKLKKKLLQTRNRTKIQKIKNVKKKPTTCAKEGKDDVNRYYLSKSNPGPSGLQCDIVPNRQRLDSLPSFIALDSTP